MPLQGRLPLSPGTTVAGKFRILRPLGQGGMGAVYVVEHVITRHERALKLLHPDMAAVPEVVDRFLREASAAGHHHAAWAWWHRCSLHQLAQMHPLWQHRSMAHHRRSLHHRRRRRRPARHRAQHPWMSAMFPCRRQAPQSRAPRGNHAECAPSSLRPRCRIEPSGSGSSDAEARSFK